MSLPPSWEQDGSSSAEWSPGTENAQISASYRVKSPRDAVRTFADQLHARDGWYLVGGSGDLSSAILRNDRLFLSLTAFDEAGIVEVSLVRR